MFLPPEAVSPRIVYLAEVQFQKDEALYHRFFSELFVYLFRNQNSFDNWFGVLIFRSRSLEPANPAMHLKMLNSPQVQRIYLDELGDQPHPSIGIRLMQLTIATEEHAAVQARRLIEAVHQEDTGFFSKQAIMDMITTIAVYKFARLSRTEVEAMIGLRLEDTRVYQEAKLEGEQSIILRLLCRRVGDLSNDLQSQIKALPLSKLEALGEAMLDFSNHEDLVNWLQAD